jgi:hypothetical protein
MTMTGLVEEFKRRSRQEHLAGNTGAAVAYMEAAIALKRELEKVSEIAPEPDFRFV